MKDMSREYEAQALRLLEQPEALSFSPVPLPQAQGGLLLDQDGRSIPIINKSAERIRPGQIALPEPLEPLRSHISDKAARQSDGDWICLNGSLACLTIIKEAKLLSQRCCQQLERFLSLRPCLCPECRTGLGLLLDRKGGVFPVALLLEGCGAVEDGFAYPLAMNLELTTQCPLRCPQCYVHLQAGRHMPREVAIRRLEEAGRLGVDTVNLSGGETMCYPWLFEIIECAVKNGIDPSVALSGFGINDKSLDRLLSAGVRGIYVSLNGPTAEINAHTRDGYELAIHLLSLLRDRGFDNTYINWVVHDSNADLLPEMLKLAEEYKVHGLMVMAFKPDSQNALPSLPSREQMQKLARQIRDYQGPLDLCIESCYSSLKALVGQSFFGNRNRGPFRGCGAGRDSFSVGLDGRLSPCRHIELFEDRDSIEEYWNQSPVLQQIRDAQKSPEEPCASCRFENACRHCMAVNLKLHGSLSRGDGTCPLAESREVGHV